MFGPRWFGRCSDIVLNLRDLALLNIEIRAITMEKRHLQYLIQTLN
jgi:hypothetical protein